MDFPRLSGFLWSSSAEAAVSFGGTDLVYNSGRIVIPEIGSTLKPGQLGQSFKIARQAQIPPWLLQSREAGKES